MCHYYYHYIPIHFIGCSVSSFGGAKLTLRLGSRGPAGEVLQRMHARKEVKLVNVPRTFFLTAPDTRAPKSRRRTEDGKSREEFGQRTRWPARDHTW